MWSCSVSPSFVVIQVVFIFDFPFSGYDSRKALSYVKKYPEFQALDPIDAKKSFNTLLSMKIPTEDIINVPSILANQTTALTNRAQILSESGFTTVQLVHIHKYLIIYRKAIDTLRLYNFIDPSTDVSKSLLASFELDPSLLEVNQKQSLEVARKIVLNEYLKRVLGFHEKLIGSFWDSYGRVKHKSGASILEMVKIVKDELDFTNERIKKNAFILHGDPENLKETLRRFKTIAGVSIKEVLSKRPKLCMANPDTIATTLDVLRRYNISDKSLLICTDVLTLGPQTVENRLIDLKSLKEFDGLLDHPRVLKLVMYQIKAKARLEYLQQLKFKCASLHILSSDNVTFERYTREGADKTKGNDIAAFISHHFGKKEDDVRELIARHPNWTCVPLKVMKSNLTLLLKERFKKEDIYKHVFLLAYPTSRIEEKLEFVRKEESCAKATKAQQLSLILYYIELDFHFTGDGVWTDYDVTHGPQKDEQTADLLSINRIKFGRKIIDGIFPTREYAWGKEVGKQ